MDLRIKSQRTFDSYLEEEALRRPSNLLEPTFASEKLTLVLSSKQIAFVCRHFVAASQAFPSSQNGANRPVKVFNEVVRNHTSKGVEALRHRVVNGKETDR